MDATMQQSIDNCHDCAEICRETLEHCREMGGKHADPRHLKLLQDCLKMCETSADFMERQSPNYIKVCELCAEICELCAESCEELAEDDELMQTCADICRRTAETCPDSKIL